MEQKLKLGQILKLILLEYFENTNGLVSYVMAEEQEKDGYIMFITNSSFMTHFRF